jgi:ribosomal-protein-alanine N-acetyltransferase
MTVEPATGWEHVYKEPLNGHSLNLRPMRLEDLDQVVILEKELFKSPWSRKSFENEMLKNKHSIPLVIEDAGTIVAYAVLWFVLDEMHIANIAVHPLFQRRGIASWMMQVFIMKAEGDKITQMQLEVRKSNVPAIRLYEKCGFGIVGVRKNYYEAEHEDAILMIRLINRRRINSDMEKAWSGSNA